MHQKFIYLTLKGFKINFELMKCAIFKKFKTRTFKILQQIFRFNKIIFWCTKINENSSESVLNLIEIQQQTVV